MAVRSNFCIENWNRDHCVGKYQGRTQPAAGCLRNSAVYSDLGSSSTVDTDSPRQEDNAPLHVVQLSCLKAIASLDSPNSTIRCDEETLEVRAEEDSDSVSSWTNVDTDEEWAPNPHQKEFDAWFKFTRMNSDCTRVPIVVRPPLQNETSTPSIVAEDSIQAVTQTGSIKHKRSDLSSSNSGGRGGISNAATEVANFFIRRDMGAIERLFGRRSGLSFAHSVINKCANANAPDAAALCFETMQRLGLRPNVVTFNSLLNVCARCGAAETAEEWWSRMEDLGVKPDITSYNTMINICAKARCPSRAEWWMREMMKDNISPCVVSFSSLISAFGNVGDARSAEAWFRSMREQGIQADVVVYNSLIDACRKSCLSERAERWFAAMISDGLKPDVRTYNCVISACASAGDQDRARFWFSEMQRAKCAVNEVTYGSMIAASAMAGDVTRAEQLMKEMEAHGLPPNLVCYNTMLRACVQGNDHVRAWVWFSRMEAAGLIPNYTSEKCMEDVCANFRRPTSRDAMLDELISRGVPIGGPALKVLSKLCGSSKKRNCAVRNSNSSISAFSAIVRAYVRARMPSNAMRWLRQAEAAGISLPADLAVEVASLCSTANDGD